MKRRYCTVGRGLSMNMNVQRGRGPTRRGKPGEDDTVTLARAGVKRATAGEQEGPVPIPHPPILSPPPTAGRKRACASQELTELSDQRVRGREEGRAGCVPRHHSQRVPARRYNSQFYFLFPFLYFHAVVTMHSVSGAASRDRHECRSA